MKHFKICTLSKYISVFLMTANLLHAMEESTMRVDPENRPLYLQTNIDTSFEAIKKRSLDAWVLRGSAHYKILSENDYTTINGFLKNKVDVGETSLTIVDVGAGDFSWGRALAKRLTRENFPGLQHVDIISMTGEESSGEESRHEGLCTLYEFGSFKIEEIQKELQLRGFDLAGKVDLIVASWTVIHLVDGLGAVQAFINLIKKDTGLLLFNKIGEIQVNGKEIHTSCILRGLLDSGLEVLYVGITEGWAIKKKSADPVYLPFAYNTYGSTEPSNEVRGFLYFDTHYTMSEDLIRRAKTQTFFRGEINGSQSLFNELKSYNEDFNKVFYGRNPMPLNPIS